MFNKETQIPVNWLVFAMVLLSFVFLILGLVLGLSNIDTFMERVLIFLSWAMMSTICFLTARQLKNS